MSPRAVALFSGGLDSMLAVRVMQTLGFEVDAIHIRTIFGCGKHSPETAAEELGVSLSVLHVGDDYLEVIRRPRYGYGRGVNPCVDCRIYMARMARQRMESNGACVVASGEILGQRAMSQKRVDLDRIARASGLEGRLLRPLSALRLAATLPEREGTVDREKLFGFTGQGRRGLVELALRLGIQRIPAAGGGCRLVEATFAPRVHDLLEHRPEAMRWEYELLAIGRHLRWDDCTKLIVGRNVEENAVLEDALRRASGVETTLVAPEGFRGPSVLVVGPSTADVVQGAGAILLHYGKAEGTQEARVLRAGCGAGERVRIEPAVPAQVYNFM